MEEKFNLEEALKKLKEEEVNKFINGKMDSEDFNEKQKGIITAWLSDAINVGYSLGVEHGIGKANPEELEATMKALSSVFGLRTKDVDGNLLKRLFFAQRCITRSLVTAMCTYNTLVDDLSMNNPSLQLQAFTCLGVSN